MKLAKRERFLVIAACTLLVLFAFFHFVLSPFLTGREVLKKGISKMEESLREMRTMAAQYRQLNESARGREEALRKRPGGFSLFSFLERAAGESDIKEKIKYMRPSTQSSGPVKESMVEMQIEEITLKQLSDYLQRIEYGDDLIRIKRLSVREARKEPGYLDAMLQVVSVDQ